MRKNGVNRTFEPLPEDGIFVDGFFPCAGFFGEETQKGEITEAQRRENAALSALGLTDVLFCRPPAAAAFITGKNAFLPYFHEASETAAKKDKAKAAIFFGGGENPFTVREKAACEKLLKDIFFSLRIGRNEIISFTCDGGAAVRKIARTYSFNVGDYPCRLCLLTRFSAQNDTHGRFRQFLLLTDAKISTPMLRRMLESLSGDPLHFSDETAGARAFDAAAFLSSCRAENYPISSPDADYAKVFRLIRSVFYDFLLYAAKETGCRLVKFRVCGAKSAREASGVALAFVRRRAVYEEIKNGRLSPLSVLECVGAAGERNRENVTAELSSAAGKVCLVCEGSLLAPRRETVRAILSEDCAELSADLSAGNYSYTACMYVTRGNADTADTAVTDADTSADT